MAYDPGHFVRQPRRVEVAKHHDRLAVLRIERFKAQRGLLCAVPQNNIHDLASHDPVGRRVQPEHHGIVDAALVDGRPRVSLDPLRRGNVEGNIVTRAEAVRPVGVFCTTHQLQDTAQQERS